LVWHYDRQGVFSMRSAYRMLVRTWERREAWLDNVASASNRAMVEKQWTSDMGTKEEVKPNFRLYQDEGSSLQIGTPGRPMICNNLV
jgi:hypothetical protein